MINPSQDLAITGWDNFYIMIGSSAGALLGLTFVVIALAADAKRASPRGLRTFISPTIGHFGTVLALSGFMLVPGQTRATMSVAFGLIGAAGLIYSLITGLHMRRMPVSYLPVLEDWLWHVSFPILTYASLLLISDLIWHAPTISLYAIALALTLFLFIGIHNAWDVATSISLRKQDET